MTAGQIPVVLSPLKSESPVKFTNRLVPGLPHCGGYNLKSDWDFHHLSDLSCLVNMQSGI